MEYIHPNMILNKLDKNIQNAIIDLLPTNHLTEEIFYDICIQFFISQSNRYHNYEKIAVDFSLHQHEKKTVKSFIQTMKNLQSNQDIVGHQRPILDKDFFQFMIQNENIIETLFDKCIQETIPFEMTYFGWKTLYRSYLLKNHNGIQERIEHLFFRVALFLHRDNWNNVKNSFQLMMEGKFIHATPTLYHAGLINSQMASCFLIGTEDSVQGIYKTISDAAIISKYAGGLGIHISNIRGENSYIYGTNGVSNGIMPMLRVYNSTSRYIDQCFEESTLIVCENGLKPISTLIPNVDKVLTMDGTFQKVLNVLEHPNITENIIRITVDTPLGEKSIVMTSQHDLLFSSPYSEKEEYESIEKATFCMKTVFKDINQTKIPIHLNHREWFCIGFLYKYNEMITQKEFKIKILQEMKLEFEELFSKFQLEYKKITVILNYDESQYHSIYKVKFPLSKIVWLDYLAFYSNDIPSFMNEMEMTTIESFYDGYNYYCKSNPSLFLEYRLGLKKSTNGRILDLEPLFDTTMTLYDLEIEKNHNYQTLIGMAHNGGGKRKGAFAMYLEPWHNDILSFIKAKRNIGHEEERARDLFYGLWINDYFMEQVEKNGDWYLISDHNTSKLQNVWGDDFKSLYLHLIDTQQYTQKLKARELWIEILKSQIETGTPYILYKDTCNRFSNQQNLGTIKSSNLCCEIIEYSDNKEYAVCNLSSISLKSCLKYPNYDNSEYMIYGKKGCFYCSLLKYYLDKYKFNYQYKELLSIQELETTKQLSTTFPIVYRNEQYIGGFTEMWKHYLTPQFDFETLKKIVYTCVENLNIVIDKNYYPLKECYTSNMKNRPIGIGVQGLADVFMELLLPYDSEKAQELNKSIFEHMYYYALEKSNELAKEKGHYDSFKGSPLSQGKFHFDLYPHSIHLNTELNWNQLRENIIQYGTRNSLLIAPMPTASTSQILGNTESFEPLTSNYYLRRTNAGEFYIINPLLKNILIATNLWDDKFIENMIIFKGSIQHMKEIPNFIKDIFRTVWELNPKHLIDMASERQCFIDQSQSFNLYLSKPDISTLNKLHFYGWKKLLKTGCYYLRSRPAISSQNFTIDPLIEKNYQICESCSS